MRTRRLKAGPVVPLTAGEFNLLITFLHSPQRVLSREQLLAASRVHGEEVYDRSIDVQILRLRRKLEADPSKPKLSTTKRGAGYVFTLAVETVDRHVPVGVAEELERCPLTPGCAIMVA